MKTNYLYIVKVEGMRCGGCEAHVNDLIRKNFDVKKVKSSHIFKKTKIYTNEKLSEEDINRLIENDGYTVKGIEVVTK